MKPLYSFSSSPSNLERLPPPAQRKHFSNIYFIDFLLPNVSDCSMGHNTTKQSGNVKKNVKKHLENPTAIIFFHLVFFHVLIPSPFPLVFLFSAHLRHCSVGKRWRWHPGEGGLGLGARKPPWKPRLSLDSIRSVLWAGPVCWRLR